MSVTNTNADKLQSVIGDDLFPTMQNISDVKQVLEFIQGVGQDLSQNQIRAILYLTSLGENKELHEKNPYLGYIKEIVDNKKNVVDPNLFIETIEALIPKPPRPVIMNPNATPQNNERGRR